MTQTGFSDIASAMHPDGEGYAAQIPSHWRQGRTAYGGITAGLAYESARAKFGPLAPLRSMLVNFIGPVGEDAQFVPTLLRQGKNVTSINVDVISSCVIGARVTLVFGHNRDSLLSVAPLLKTGLPEAEDCENFTPPQIADFVPQFFHNFDTRLISGARPMSGAKEGYIHVWSRHKDERSRATLGGLITLGDVLPPAAMPMFTTMGAVSSVSWMLNFLTDDPFTHDEWWRLDSRLVQAQNGYSSQTMNIWNAGGALVAQGQQSVALFT